ncbi:MAG: hypothetical protein ACJ79K_09910 [Gemmatimonadaceae bacterium]
MRAGSTFTVTLPMAEAGSHVRPQDQALHDAHGEPRTIEVLVVDNDEDTRRVANRVLTEKGIRVREAIDGEKGLAAMSAKGSTS